METKQRSDEEILARLVAVRESGLDMFGAQQGDLIAALSFEKAAPYLTAKGLEAGADAWNESRQSPHDAIREYLPFALGKAQDHRGLSAARSIDHMRSWVWLMGDDAYESVDWDAYAMYGVPILRRCAELVEFEFPDDEDLVRMSRGEPCEPGCQGGC